MKKHHLLILVVVSTLLLSGCHNSKYSCKGTCYALSGSPLYVIGYGSYVNGLNYDIGSGVPLETTTSSKTKFIQEVNDLYLSVGDVFRLEAEEYEYTVESDKYNIDSEAFIGNNLYLSDNNEVDVLKSGYYNITVTYDGNNKTQIVDITLGKDTSDNLNPSIVSGPVTIDIFASGDQHGVIEETQYGDNTLPSMPEYVSFINEEMARCSGPSILLSNGDLWQGTYESNFNYGSCLNEIINNVGYASFTLGNHEWDWGQDVIRENKINSKVPYLGANVIDNNTGEIVNYAEPYTIVEEEGLKIGIIGVIGKGQITSITSTMVEDISFSDEESAIIKYSDKLRDEFKCDIIIASMHAGTSDERSVMRNLSKDSEVTGKPYVDAVFTAHDHEARSGTNYGMIYANSGNNNQFLSHISLTYSDGEVIESSSENISTESVYLDYNEDITTREIIDSYCDESVKAKGSEVVGTIDSDFSESKEAPNMLAEAMYDYVSDSGYSIDVAICNNARADLYQGEVTYSNLLDAYPFFNKTIIMEVYGIELRKVARSNYYYSSDPNIEIESDYTHKYRIAVCDYLAFHTGTNRAYDNFSYSLENINQEYQSLDKYPCDIVCDYMKGINGTLKAEDYYTSNFTFFS